MIEVNIFFQLEEVIYPYHIVYLVLVLCMGIMDSSRYFIRAPDRECWDYNLSIFNYYRVTRIKADCMLWVTLRGVGSLFSWVPLSSKWRRLRALWLRSEKRKMFQCFILSCRSSCIDSCCLERNLRRSWCLGSYPVLGSSVVSLHVSVYLFSYICPVFIILVWRYAKVCHEFHICFLSRINTVFMFCIKANLIL